MFKIDNVDSDAYEDGQWAEYNGFRFKIRPARNMAFTKAMERLRKPYMRNGRFSGGVEDSTRLMHKALAEAVLVDWEGVKDDSGSEVAYSPDKGEQALEQNPAFSDFVAGFAGDLANYEAEERAERTGK